MDYSDFENDTDSSESVHEIYEELLQEDINQAFDDTPVKEHEAERGSVFDKVRLFEEKIKQLGDQSIGSNYRNAHEEWKIVAANPTREFSWNTSTDISLQLDTIHRKQKINESTKKTLYGIANELLETEVTYVNILHLIDQKFHKAVLKASLEKKIMPIDDVKKIFRHLPGIYLFHSKFLLPRLQQRLKDWDSNPRICDIMIQAAPYLKSYSFYIQTIEDAKKAIDDWSKKSRKFLKIITSIKHSDESKSFNLKDRMDAPKQRLFQYIALLKRYVETLPTEADERKEAKDTLDLILLAAGQSEESLKEKFNDMLLYCKESSTIDKLQNKQYKIAAKIDLLRMYAVEIENAIIPNAFCVRGIQKCLEFSCCSAEEMRDWLEAINKAVNECTNKNASFINKGRLSAVDLTPILPDHILNDSELGKIAPRWIRVQEVSMCRRCYKQVGTLLARNHCRACGRVFCGDCCSSKITLDYDPDEKKKVCNRCFLILNLRQEPDDKDGLSLSKEGLLTDMLFITEEPEPRVKMFCVIIARPEHKLRLYCYKAPRDPKPLKDIPLNGMEAELIESYIKLSGCDGMTIYLWNKDEHILAKWKNTINLLTITNPSNSKDDWTDV